MMVVAKQDVLILRLHEVECRVRGLSEQMEGKELMLAEKGSSVVLSMLQEQYGVA